MKKKTHRILSILLALAMAAGMLPGMRITVQAESAGDRTGVKAIQAGTGGITDPEAVETEPGKTYYSPGSYVWFGVNGAQDQPIKWRVLDAQTANDGTSPGLFLLSEYLLGKTPFNFDATPPQMRNTYQGSGAQAWCLDFAANTDNFTVAEQNTMLGVEKQEDEESAYNLYWKRTHITEKDVIFFLSACEAYEKVANYEYAPGLAATYPNDDWQAWWLRSPSYKDRFSAGKVAGNGDVQYSDVRWVYSARPAFNVDLNTVLFSSPAEGGKTGDGALEAVGDYSGNEWKLTILDPTRYGFEAVFDTNSGDSVDISWTGAKTGAGEYISAVIMDSTGAVTHYGRLTRATGSGSITVDVRGKLGSGSALYVFNEQCNGDKRTDSASPLRDGTEPQERYEVWVSGAQVTDLNRDDVLGKGKVVFTPPEGSSPAKLTLKDALLYGVPMNGYGVSDLDTAAIYSDIDLELVLEGENTIIAAPAADPEGNSYGVFAGGSAELTVSGPDNLTVSGAQAKDSAGIKGGTIHIDGGTVTASGGEAAANSSGIAAGTLTINAGTVIATGGEAGADSRGMAAETLTINAGTVTSSGGEAGTNSSGIAAENLTVSAGTVTATGGDAPLSYGFYSGTVDATINGGTVVAAGNSAAMNRSPELSGYRPDDPEILVSSSVSGEGASVWQASSGPLGGSTSENKYVRIDPPGAVPLLQLAVNLQSASIRGGQESTFWFGRYLQSGSSGSYNLDPIKWRVLQASGKKVLLLADQNLDVMPFHVTQTSVTWETSTLRSWLNGYGASENLQGTDYSRDSFIGSAFSEKERAVIADTTLDNINDNATTDKVFPLSVEEARIPAYGFFEGTGSSQFFDPNSGTWINKTGRVAQNTQYVTDGGRMGSLAEKLYWLRTCDSGSQLASAVNANGIINKNVYWVNQNYAVRPGMTLNLDEALFLCAATGAKEGEGTLAAVGKAVGSEWKLTLLDDAHNSFDAHCAAKDGGVWTVSYSGAESGSGEYISAVIVNVDGVVTHYGRWEAVSESGSIHINTSGKLRSGGRLYVFNEQYNGDYLTDYTSPLIDVTEISYRLWVGDTPVTENNCDNILNAIDPQTNEPTASYDPATKTLTLRDPDITGAYQDYKIYSKDSLTIEGMATITGDKGIAVVSEREELNTLTIQNAELDISAQWEAIYARNTHLVMNSGTVTAKSKLHRAVNVQVHGSFTMNGGELTVETSSDTRGALIVWQGNNQQYIEGENNIVINGGRISVKAVGNSPISAVGVITLPANYYAHLYGSDTPLSLSGGKHHFVDENNVKITNAQIIIEPKPAITPSTHDVTFIVVNGAWDTGDEFESPVSVTITVDHGHVLSAADLPGTPVADDGYGVGAWDVDPVGQTVTGDSTFTWSYQHYTVSYVMVGGNASFGTAPASKKTEWWGAENREILGGSAINARPTMLDNRYDFGGTWYTDQACTQKADGWAEVTGNVTLYGECTGPYTVIDQVLLIIDPPVAGDPIPVGQYYWNGGGEGYPAELGVSQPAGMNDKTLVAMAEYHPDGGDVFVAGQSYMLRVLVGPADPLTQRFKGHAVGAPYNLQIAGASGGIWFVGGTQTEIHLLVTSVETPQTPAIYMVTFDANGGTVNGKATEAALTGSDGKLAGLPTPVRRGSYTFDGWFTKAGGGEKVEPDRVYAAETTLYAHWTYTGGGGGSVTPSQDPTNDPSQETVHNCPSAHLKDVDPDAWYHEYVDYVVERGLMCGMADDLFGPDVTTSRAMIVTILYALEGRPAVDEEAPFDDVDEKAWYADAVAWAKKNDIVEGYGNGKFGPDDLITREQFAAILYGYARFKSYDVSKAANLSGYSDAGDISPWALTAMKWAVAENLITGRTATTLVPKGEATRAEAATILMQFIENVK